MATWNKIFFRGLVAIIPIAVTLYLLFWMVSLMEALVGQVIQLFVPDGFYIPGLGVIFTFILIFVFGLLLNNFVMEELVQRLEAKLKTIPFFKAIYSPLRDLMNLFAKSGASNMKSVVLVNLSPGIKILGVITREDFKDMPPSLQYSDTVAVYCPWSYGMGGFTLLASKSQIEPIDLPIEKAMSLAITGWVKVDPKLQSKEMEPPS